MKRPHSPSFESTPNRFYTTPTLCHAQSPPLSHPISPTVTPNLPHCHTQSPPLLWLVCNPPRPCSGSATRTIKKPKQGIGGLQTRAQDAGGLQPRLNVGVNVAINKQNHPLAISKSTACNKPPNYPPGATAAPEKRTAEHEHLASWHETPLPAFFFSRFFIVV